MSFTLRPITAGTYDEVVAEAGEGLPSRAVFAGWLQNCGAATRLHQVAAVTPAGRMVGFGLAVTGPWDPYLRDGHFELRVKVEPAWRRRGVGRAIYADLEVFARANGAVALEGSTADDNPVAMAFAERRGFAVAQHVYPSRLDLARFDPAPFAGVTAAAEAAGLRFTSLADYPETDEWFARFVDLYFELSEDVPGMAGRAQ